MTLRLGFESGSVVTTLARATAIERAGPGGGDDGSDAVPTGS